jgi:hypothetical protein
MTAQNSENFIFPRGLDTSRHFYLAGGGGVKDEIVLAVRAFLAFRQLFALARCHPPHQAAR